MNTLIDVKTSKLESLDNNVPYLGMILIFLNQSGKSQRYSIVKSKKGKYTLHELLNITLIR